MTIDAELDPYTKTIHIEQTITFYNNYEQPLFSLYLNDWNHSYSSKSTPLAKRFAEEFNNKFHFAKKKDRGYTMISAIKGDKNQDLTFKRLDNQQDVVRVFLKQPVLPKSSYTLTLSYDVIVPSDKFTSNGVTEDNVYNLKYWYMTLAVFDGNWQYYSNKNIDDLYVEKNDITLKLTYPLNYTLVSDLDRANTEPLGSKQQTFFTGKDRVSSEIIFTRLSTYEFVQTDDFTIISNLPDKGIDGAEKAIITDKITRFITEHLGQYPHKSLLVSEIEYKKDPLYGLNQLPDFLRPFPDNFQYEIKLFKTALKRYLDNTLLVNPRTDYWLRDGLIIYYLMKYIETFYPNTKLIGTLANIWGIRSFHAADLKYNDQFNLYYMQMARTNRDQPLTTSKDSLIKFNASIAGKYKAGVGLRYLDNFINNGVVEKSIQQFLKDNQLKSTKTKAFETILKQNSEKNIDWFFNEYIASRVKLDFRIKDIETQEDSVTFTIKNKRQNSMPVSLFKLKNDTIVSKEWIENITGEKTLTLPKDNLDKLALNFDGTIPEFNLRDNYKSLKPSIFGNKPLQLRLVKDIEDPYYNQIFLMPIVQFKNIYDGLTLGTKFYNKTLLRKRLNYRFSPQYATNSRALTGGGSVFYIQNIEKNQDLFSITYGVGGSYSSFAEDAFVTKITPSIRLSFRDKDNFRSNKRYSILARFSSIKQEIGDDAIVDVVEPDYNVFNLRFSQSYIDLLKFENSRFDLQFAKDFGKASFNYRYRKLLNSNQQFSFRFFAGLFIYNNTDPTSNYFSFALDRPTDYLFDYNYLGRSEASGIFSQQLILAEGGFKSKLQPAFANQWMTTSNVSISIWRYIQAYGDLGLVKNKDFNAEFVYGSGIRLNLVQDYFEIYFPVYSNLGWEIAQDNYDQKIRFIFTADLDTLFGLFRRKWY
ncbi:metalloprotease [Ichthyenterobacterium sp. W332]|uniref:Metalloprotease n=1 Tax=Microcosmobacter mediterraneus TaxID=3075607 RepID=A0ABU2YI80_9FLAO|nr:metalloprotease [Ichthyenterobacterium sp. W332]MDT0557475.1 metalloprotease [Ichthyenterobacterium sp. W332]